MPLYKQKHPILIRHHLHEIIYITMFMFHWHVFVWYIRSESMFVIEGYFAQDINHSCFYDHSQLRTVPNLVVAHVPTSVDSMGMLKSRITILNSNKGSRIV